MRRHRDRQGLPELWAHNHELYRNKIFKNKSKFAQTTVNLFFKTINSLKAHLTDSKPRASIMPRGDTQDDIANGWQAAYDTWWELTKQQYAFQESVGRSELYGFQCDQMWFNPRLEGGVGEVETRRWDTFSILFWPGHQEIQTQPMMAAFEAMELGELYDLWPDAEGKVKAEPEYSEMLGEARNWIRGNRSRQLRPMGSPSGFYVPEPESQTPQDGMGVQRALVIWLWCKDYSMMWVDPRTGEEVQEGVELVSEPTVDPMTGQQIEGQPIEPEQWSRYPGFIRLIAVTNKGNLVLEDRANPSINPNLGREVGSGCYLWDKFPFIKRYSHSDDISEYGLSIIEQIETLVIEVCKKLTQFGVHLDTQCRSPLILPQNCGVKKDRVSNLPARIWEPIVSMAQQIRFLQVPAAGGDIIPYIELLIRLVDAITGITDVSEGRRPTGITAGIAIAALQEKAQVVFREKIRNIDLSLEEQGRMYISLGQNWYTEEQKLRYQGKKQEELINFKGTEYQGELAFHVEAGSTMPNNRVTRQSQMVELAKMGKLTLKTLFKELEVPNGDEEAARLEAGPLGMALEKLGKSGMFDPQTLQAMQNIIQMDDADFKKAFSQGE